MAKKKDIGNLEERIDLLERKIDIIETKVEENKRFAFDEIRAILIRVSNLEDSFRKLNTEVQNLK